MDTNLALGDCETINILLGAMSHFSGVKYLHSSAYGHDMMYAVFEINAAREKDLPALLDEDQCAAFLSEEHVTPAHIVNVPSYEEEDDLLQQHNVQEVRPKQSNKKQKQAAPRNAQGKGPNKVARDKGRAKTKVKNDRRNKGTQKRAIHSEDD